MSTTRKHIPLTITRPGFPELHKISWQASDANQLNIIPYRYPFTDIKNHAALKALGYFRHEDSTTVDTSIGGSATADTQTTLGFQLPPTEKLILLVKCNLDLTAEKAITITVKGSEKYGIDDEEFVLTQDDDEIDGIEVVANDMFEIDLFNFGLLLDEDGEVVIETEATVAGDKEKVSFALIARMG